MVQKTILKYALSRTLYVLACEHDGIDIYSSFSVFSKDNPWALKLDRLESRKSDVIGFRFNLR